MNARTFLRQNLPPQLKNLARQVREAISPPPIDDQVLHDYQIKTDPSEKLRITMVMQFLGKGTDFGGAATGIDIFARLCMALNEDSPFDVRIIITDVLSETDPSIMISYTAKSGLKIAPEQIELLADPLTAISVRKNEVFFVLSWWNALNFAKVRDLQAKAFETAPKPLVWLMQDYDPAFMEFSSAHMLARAAYDTSEPLWGIINSSSLARYIALMGHAPDKTFVFEPLVPDALRPYLDRVANSERKQRVLVYGRPSAARNCFPALVRGLRRWVRDYPEFSDWEVVSAGLAHDPVDLGEGRKLVSVGKLSLPEYAQMLLESSAGVSLMASPHPSYPPLEMAHFGVRTVTNSYTCKDLSSFHPNITSIPSIAEDAVAQALALSCRKAAEPTVVYADPEYVRDTPYPFMGDLRDALLGVVK